MTDPDRIQFLNGQVQALLCFSFAIIEMHQDRRQLLSHLEQNLEAALAKISCTAVREPLVEGLQDMKSRLLEYTAKSVARQSND